MSPSELSVAAVLPAQQDRAAPKGNRQCLPPLHVPGGPSTALAPMQDVTTLPFMQTIARFGAPDYFFTEYFRVHAHSKLEPHILKSITHNDTGRPVFAQLIGEDLTHMERTVRELVQFRIAGIDLNMGCPAPKVYKKNVGGGLLRDPAKVDELLGCLRAVCPGLFTVKMRIGFDCTDSFEKILDLINRHRIDLLSIHGRTVKEMYRGAVDYELIGRAVKRVRCPVLANGNITSAAKAVEVLKYTGSHGVMIGRSAIRNPWIFRQVRERISGETMHVPVLRDVREYIGLLWQNTYVGSRDTPEDRQTEIRHVARMKKFLNFLGESVDREGAFLHAMRRATTENELMRVCDRFLINDGRADLPFSLEPFPNIVARPTREL